jgi:hypothetical protein
MSDNVHIHQSHIAFRFLMQDGFTPSEKLVGQTAILMTYHQGAGFQTNHSRVDKLVTLTGLDQNEISLALTKLAGNGWLSFFENPDGTWGYRIPEQRLEETRAKRRAYLAESRARSKVTIHADGTAEVVIRPEGVGHG